jgi:hypothetical protein
MAQWFVDLKGVEFTEEDLRYIEASMGFKIAEAADAAQDVRDAIAETRLGRFLLKAVDSWWYILTWGGRL